MSNNDKSNIVWPNPSGMRGNRAVGAGPSKADLSAPVPSAIQVPDDEQTTYVPVPQDQSIKTGGSK